MRTLARLAALAALAAAPAVHAQVVAMGTTQAGATAQLSTVVAKVMTDRGGLQVRPQPMAGVAQYGPLVNAGEIDFGVANLVEARFLVAGREIVEKPNPDLRLVARLVPWYNGLVVKADSPIRTLKDLKGQAAPAGFAGNPLGRVLMDGYLANAGLKIGDTKQVLVPAFPRMFELFKQGQLATAISTIGSPVLKEWEAAVGPVRFLPFDDAPAAVAAMQQFIPGSYVVEYKPEPGVVGVPAPTKILVYDYVLFASAKVPDAVVAKAVESLFANPGDLKAASPLFREFDPALMGRDLGIAYHPGAIAFYRAKGVWKGQ
jgi:TRAP transporter TAXI family solute receptor